MSQNLGHPDPTIRQALREWAKQRDELTHRRQEILDAAWRAGDRNIRGLAEDARVTRDTELEIRRRSAAMARPGSSVAVDREVLLEDLAELVALRRVVRVAGLAEPDGS